MDVSDPSARGILHSPFFWRLFACFGAVALLTGLVVGWQIENSLEQNLLADLQADLRAHCRVLEPFVRGVFEGEAQEQLQPELEQLKQTGMRITLLLADGRVVADSDEDPRSMENHASRPEIVQARAASTGSSRRLSHTLGVDLQYEALRVDGPGGVLGYVRAAKPATLIESQLGIARRSVLLGTAAGVVAALLLGLLLSRRITQPIAALTRTARELLAGRYDSRVHVTHADEIGILGQTLNELGAEITRRIAALSQEDAQLRAMLASMIEGVVAVDEEGRIAFINQAARTLLEIGETRAEERTLWALAPIRELEEILMRARTSGAHELREVELFRGGKERVFQAHASPFHGGGKGGFVLVLHDITELRRLERVRRDFVANVSHELKTPLTSIQGFVETLLSGALADPENNVRFLQRIEANVKRLTSLVSDLLSLARIESGQLDVQRTAVDWREVLEGVLRLRESALTAKGLRLEVEGRERPLRVRGDKEAMTQVLDNLIDNAIQYTGAGGRVRVALASREGAGVLSVEDSGMGIPAADLDRIFERFYRVDKARSRAVGGTGLGLSIVKNLVLRMEGDVRVESVEGRGSTFSVELPLA